MDILVLKEKWLNKRNIILIVILLIMIIVAISLFFILNKLKNNELKNILFMATGALMSPTSTQQGESIPSIAHLINIKSS